MRHIQPYSSFKGPLADPRQLLTTESSLKIMKNVFYFMLKALFVLEIFSFLSWLFGYVEKRFDKKAEVHSKIYDVPDWTINNYNAKNTAILPDFRAIRPKLCGNSAFLQNVRTRESGEITVFFAVLQYTYCPISQEVKASRQQNLVRL